MQANRKKVGVPCSKIFYQVEGDLEQELPGGADMRPPKGFVDLIEASCLQPFDKSKQV